MSRIFVVGLNKSGTTSLHLLFKRSRISSLHFRAPGVGNAALRLMNNIGTGRPLLHGMDQFTAYSDFSYADRRIYIEGARFFRQFHAEYPDAWFILNMRDETNWLNSRLNHMNGSLRDRAMAVYGVDQTGLITLWRQQYRTHAEEVRTYFAGHHRFIEFHIERDPIGRLVRFLGPAVSIDPKHWGQHNQSGLAAARDHTTGAGQS
ncbi:MAG: sulfotransferase [Pseudomonadota bacterium]